MRRCIHILTVFSALLFVGVAGILAYTSFRCRGDVGYRPSVVLGSGWEFYAAPGGVGLTITHETEPVRITDAMTVDQWKAWSLKTVIDDEPMHEFGGFKWLTRGTLSRTDHSAANDTYTGYDIGWWRAVFVPRWAALLLPALLALVGLARMLRRRQARRGGFAVAIPSPTESSASRRAA